MNQWLLPAIACLTMWGISRFFPKLATNHIDPHSAFFYEVMGEVIVAFGILVMIGFKPNFEWRGASFALIGGVFGGLGVLFYLLAAGRGNVSQLVVVSSLYPIITVLLGVVLLKEQMHLKQWIAMGLGLLAIALVST
ncbi:hypothetical protein NBRC116494_33290 [Aurantivibrio plasticivorans]